MGVISIRPAVRAGARTLTVLAGVSGSGKTLSALYLAYGMANYDASKIGLIDTENKRGSIYADALARLPERPTQTKFLIGDLVAPFSPSRYAAAIQEFQDAGIEVLVIDSGSHEWEGIGGCEEIANAPDRRGNEPKVGRWNLAKREHRRFMNAMLQCDMHVICCLRAREKVRIIEASKSESRRTEFIPLGVQPIAEKNFMFEATISLLLHDENYRRNGSPFYEKTKVPGDVAAHFPGDRYLRAEAGAAIRAWVDGGATVDPKLESWKNRLLSNTEQGEAHVGVCWAKVPEPVRSALGDAFREQLFTAAREFDAQRAQAAPEEPEPIRTANARTHQGQPLDFS